MRYLILVIIITVIATCGHMTSSHYLLWLFHSVIIKTPVYDFAYAETQTQRCKVRKQTGEYGKQAYLSSVTSKAWITSHLHHKSV